MRKLCSNRGCSRVIAAAMFYPEKMYDKVNYRSNQFRTGGWYGSQGWPKASLLTTGVNP